MASPGLPLSLKTPPHFSMVGSMESVGAGDEGEVGGRGGGGRMTGRRGR